MQVKRIFIIAASATLLSASAWSQTITCSSEDGKRNFCRADTRQGVQMIRQRSGSPCTQGVTWDYDGKGIWVDRGCRADFALQAASQDSSANRKLVTCSSEDGKRHYCDAETRAGVQMIRQRSGSPCVKDSTWGFDDRGIWVDRGCRADFALETGPAGYYDRRRASNSNDSSRQTITCSSEDGGRHYCEAETRAGVKLLRQRSGSPCIKDSTWGFDNRGIWVDRGCRADFMLEAGVQDDGPCRQSVGVEQANILANQCMQVSPATRPPCNVMNSCSMIKEEIRRGCAQLGGNAPGFCSQYR